jgi:hypothetical protein
MVVEEGGSLLQQHGAMEIHRRGLLICARQGSIVGAGSDASLLLCLGEAGKGHVVGLLALQDGDAGFFRGQAGGDLILLGAGCDIPPVSKDGQS